MKKSKSTIMVLVECVAEMSEKGDLTIFFPDDYSNYQVTFQKRHSKIKSRRKTNG